VPRELFFGYVPLRVILAFTQPAGNLFRSLLVVDFGDDERALPAKKLLSSAQDFVFTALHVDFHQLRQGYTRANKVVEADYRYVYYIRTQTCTLGRKRRPIRRFSWPSPLPAQGHRPNTPSSAAFLRTK
jgi:hypothetical protein